MRFNFTNKESLLTAVNRLLGMKRENYIVGFREDDTESVMSVYDADEGKVVYFASPVKAVARQPVRVLV